MTDRRDIMRFLKGLENEVVEADKRWAATEKIVIESRQRLIKIKADITEIRLDLERQID